MAEKSLFGLDNFLNIVRTKHLPRTERFEVTFNLPKELKKYEKKIGKKLPKN